MSVHLYHVIINGKNPLKDRSESVLNMQSTTTLKLSGIILTGRILQRRIRDLIFSG